MLRLAKQRIEADTKRLETCNKRIIELENEVASLRVRNHSYIYMEGAINHDTANRRLMNNILPPPKMSSRDLTGGLTKSFSKAQNNDSLFPVNKEGILNVKLDKIDESGDGDHEVEDNQNPSQYKVNEGSNDTSPEKKHEVQDIEKGSHTHRSHHSSHNSHSQSRSSTHRSHKSVSSNDNHDSRKSKNLS